MEMFFVAMNYPAESLRFNPRAGGHHPRPGRVLFSNAFSAVRRDVIERFPFDENVPVSEDQVWAHRVLAAGFSIAYAAPIEALHAHRYSLRGLYTRSFLVGRALAAAGMDRGATLPESIRFLRSELAYFLRQGHSHAPRAAAPPASRRRRSSSPSASPPPSYLHGCSYLRTSVSSQWWSPLRVS